MIVGHAEVNFFDWLIVIVKMMLSSKLLTSLPLSVDKNCDAFYFATNIVKDQSKFTSTKIIKTEGCWKNHLLYFEMSFGSKPKS